MAAATFTNTPGFSPGSSRATAVMALKSGWTSLIFPVDQAQSWTCTMHSPVPYISESALCSSCKRNPGVSGAFGPRRRWNATQGPGRFQLGTHPLLMNVHLCSQSLRAPSTRAKIVKQHEQRSLCTAELFKVPEGLTISRRCVHVQYEQDFWVLAFKMTIKNTAGMFQQLYGLP